MNHINLRTLFIFNLLIVLPLYSHLLIANELDPEFRLISNNGLSWNEVSNIPSHLKFNFPRTSYSAGGNTNTTWDLDTKVTLYKGNCQNTSCATGQHTVLLSAQNLSNENFNIGPLAPNTVFGQTGFFTLNNLTNFCNNALQNNPDAIYTEQKIKKDFYLTAHIRGNRTLNGPAFQGQGHRETNVNIKKLVKFDTDITCQSIGVNPGSLEANELKVFLATNANAVSQPSAATECPMVKFTTRIKTNRAGTLPVKLSQQIGINPIINKQRNISVTLQADGSFVGRHEEWISIDQSSVLRVKAEEVDNVYAFGDENLTTPWRDISLVCSGTNGSGLTSQIPTTEGPGSGPKTNPNLPTQNSGLSILPDHTGGGGNPTGLSGNGQQAHTVPIKKTKTKAGLRSDGELVQAKKSKQLLRHELSHTTQHGNKTSERNKGIAILSTNKKNNISPKNNKEAKIPSTPKTSNITLKRGVVGQSSSANKDAHDKYTNAETSHTTPVPTLYLGKEGDNCNKRQFPKPAVIKQRNTQFYISCKVNKVIIDKKSRVINPWRKGNSVFKPKK